MANKRVTLSYEGDDDNFIAAMLAWAEPFAVVRRGVWDVPGGRLVESPGVTVTIEPAGGNGVPERGEP